MARFLTPSKLGLLALIELYTDGVVPTASTIPILSFILNQILPSSSKPQPGDPDPAQDLPFILDLKSFEPHLNSHPAAAGLPGRTVWDHFLKKLWEIDSLESLHVFFTKRINLLAKTREEVRRDGELGIPPPSADMIMLSRTSPLGSFVRRAKVEYERLRFSDALRLWVAFTKWRGELRFYWAKRNGGMARWAGDRALAEGEEEWGTEATEMLEMVAYGGLSADDAEDGTTSTDDIEKLLEFQVEQMQSTHSANTLAEPSDKIFRTWK